MEKEKYLMVETCTSNAATMHLVKFSNQESAEARAFTGSPKALIPEQFNHQHNVARYYTTQNTSVPRYC